MMNRLIFCFLVLLGTISVLQAQEDIVAMEYYIDTDPGQGAGTPIPITTGQDLDINFTVPTSSMGLANGTHILVIRAQQATGEWGFYESRLFYIQEAVPAQPVAADIDMLEYFIDVDPGQGAATTVSVATGADIDINQLIPSGTLTEGFHSISYRARNTDGNWGFYEKRIFYIQPPVDNNATPPDITEMEYYFNEDPGQGNATPFTITAGTVVDINELLISNTLPEGLHLIGIRAKNANGDWGFAESRRIYINPAGVAEPVPAAITKLEYFFNDDPGIGAGTPIDIDPDATEVDIASILLPTEETIPVGTNSVTFRAQNTNGLWSFSETREFDVIDDCAQPTADFAVELACEDEVVNFIDNSLDVQADAEYRWYFEGDNVPDDFTSGSTSYIFDNPGDYTISLAISQGQICYDSIATTITIKPNPIVVFSADRVSEDGPTSFTVDQFDVEPGYIWEWDFQTDGIIDDNTAGNTSYQFPADGSYLTTLTVRDGNGCGTSYSKTVYVDPSEGEETGPQADFIASESCFGNTTFFNDVSTNIPAGSTYSWDFDGDGTVDDATVGNTQFIYSAPGVYTAQLVIDTGSELITNSEIVEVIDYPEADFSAPAVCQGDVTTFTDLSTSLTVNATYQWDFEGDGTFDDNTTGDVNFTYTSAGTYSALLVIDNGNGCIDTRVRNVTVVSQPIADFAFNTQCAGQSTAFTNTSSNESVTANYNWDFENDGIIDSNQESPSQVFSAAGSYDVRLLVDNGSGCTDEVIKTVSISAEVVPDFSFSNGCAGASINFTDNSTNVESDAIYSWDFDGNGTEDSNQQGDVAFTYINEGTYNVSLSIDNGDGCQQSISKLITIIASPIADFTFEGVCLGSVTNFINESSSLTSSVSFAWDFDNDGTVDSNASNPQYSFNSAGDQQVSLTVDNGNGCIDQVTLTVTILSAPTVSFNYDAGCEGEEVLFIDSSTDVAASALYEWDFDNDNVIDDNTTGNTSFTYAGSGPYFATLTIDNGDNCIASSTVEVLFENSPNVDFNAVDVCLGEEMIFNDLSNNVLNSATYSWDFNGDGNIDSNVPGSTSFTYDNAGTYTARLTVNNSGCASFIEKQVNINALPEIDLGEDKVLCAGESLTLDPGPGYSSYEWSDGSNNQTLTVSEADTFSLTVADENLCESTDEIIVTRSDLPSASFTIQIELLEFQAIVKFENLSQNATEYSWDFGDGETSNQENPSHQYNDIDIFNGSIFEVCLTSINTCDSAIFCELVPLVVTDLDELEGEVDLKIYPNPSSGSLNVAFDKTLKIRRIFIYDFSGKLYDQREVQDNSQQARFTQIANGSYYIRIVAEDKMYGETIVVR